VRKLNFGLDKNAQFAIRREKPDTVSGFVKAVRSELMRRAEAEAADAGINDVRSVIRGTQSSLVSSRPMPRPASAARVVIVKQYRYRSTWISISGNSDGFWQAAIAHIHPAPDSDSGPVCESPDFDCEDLALSYAIELVEHWFSGQLGVSSNPIELVELPINIP
jgi:hypothetical protein